VAELRAASPVEEKVAASLEGLPAVGPLEEEPLEAESRVAASLEGEPQAATSLEAEL
jgi:hypothetical protein